MLISDANQKKFIWKESADLFSTEKKAIHCLSALYMQRGIKQKSCFQYSIVKTRHKCDTREKIISKDKKNSVTNFGPTHTYITHENRKRKLENQC